MRPAFNNPVGRGSRLAALAAEPAASTRPVRRLARLLSLVLLAAVVLWAGPALAQTVTLTHMGSANVKDGKVQLVEGGASTTFQVSLSADFISDLKTTHTEAARTGTRLGMQLWTFRSSSDVGWTTTGTTFIDRTDDYDIQYSGTSLKSYYGSARSIFGEAVPERLLSRIPLDSTNTDGSTSTTAAIDSFAVNSFPNTFTIQADTDSVYFERDESIRVKVAVLVLGTNAQPAFSSFFIFSDELTFDLVDGALPAPTGKPTMPANLTATAGKGAVTLAWDAVDTTSSNTNRLNDVQITKHQVRQSTDGGNNYGTWTDIPNSAPDGVNATTYTMGSLMDDTKYTFQVRAVNDCTATTGCGESDPATAVMATPDADGLAQPTGLMATAGNTQVTLTWTDPGDATIQYYQYQQKEGSAAFGSWTAIPGSRATTTSWRSTGLLNGTAYNYRIRARTDQEVGPASDAVTATPQGTPPAAPVLTATPRSGGVTLSWPNPVDDSILRYEYQYKIGTGIYGSWQPAQEVHTVGATHQFPVGGLTNGTSHTFRIRAVNADGNATSNEATATPVLGVPAKPTGLTIRKPRPTRGGDPHRVLEWDAVADPSILRYEYTTDEGRTWTHLTSSTRPYKELPEEEFEFPSGYTFRIRAVNAAGPGPASDPPVDEGDWSSARAYIQSASLEWNATTKKATLIWDPKALGPRLGGDAEFLWWQLFSRGNNGWSAHLPIATTRYEIPATFNAGDSITVYIAGCESPGCITSADWGAGGVPRSIRDPGLSFVAGGPSASPTGFSATPGDTQITLAWDDPMDSSITKYQYVLNCGGSNVVVRGRDIPDGDDADSNPGNETSYTITNLSNGTDYTVRLRAVNANGAGPWTECIRNVVPLAAGVPAAPTGVVQLYSGDRGLTRWDDPQDPSITGYQGWSGSWEDLPGTDATTTGVDRRLENVRAVNANGFGRASYRTVVVSPAPARPTGLKAAPANGRVTLTWDDPGNGVYIWFYRYTTDGGETWTEMPGSESTAEGQLTRYTVPDLTNGQAYTFGIEAVNDAGTSPPPPR